MSISSEKEFNKKYHSSANLLPYIGFVSPSLILNKDGSLAAFFEFEGRDADSISIEDKEINAANLENATRLLGGKITMHWHVRHTRYAGYPSQLVSNNPVSAKMAELYEADFNKSKHYKNKHVLSLVYHAPLGADRFFDKFSFYLNKQKESFVKSLWLSIKDLMFFSNAFDFDQKQLNIDIKTFDEIIEMFLQSSPSLKMKPLMGEDAVTYLHQIINLASDPFKVNLPNSLLLDGYLPDNEITVGENKILFEGATRKCYCAAISVKDYPTHTATWMNDLLLKVKGEVLVSHSFRLLDNSKARSVIDGAVRYHDFNAVPLIKRTLAKLLKIDVEPRADAYKKMLEAEVALAKVNNERKVFCLHNMTLLAYADTQDECDDLAKEVMGSLNQMGFIGIRETTNLLPSFQGTMPGQWDKQPRQQILSITNLSDLAPINTLQTGKPINEWLSEQAGKLQEAMGAFRTRFGVPFLMNFHHGSLGHTIIIGPAGSGKTVFESLLIAMFQKYNPVTFVFDKDRSCNIPIVLQGGGYINIKTGNVKFNPLKLLADPKHFAWLASFLEGLLTARGDAYRTEDEKIVWASLNALAKMDKANWRLSKLASLLGKELSERLEMWLEGKRYGYLFDNDEDTFDISNMTGMEMGDLIKNHPIAAIAFMDYAFYQLDRKFDGKRPGLIDIQEAWFMMKDERFAARLDDWLRTMRKRNVVVVMSTQSMQEINDSEFAMSFIDNIPNRIFLPNPSAMTHIRVYKSLFQLNDHQIEEIKSATQNKHYYLVTPDLSRMLEVPIKKDLLAYLRADGRALEVFARHEQSGQKDWQENYIKEIAQF